jgi:hypothetical protein
MKTHETKLYWINGCQYNGSDKPGVLSSLICTAQGLCFATQDGDATCSSESWHRYLQISEVHLEHEFKYNSFQYH